MIQGMGGIMDLTGEPDGEPQKIGVAYADIFTGVYAAVAILAALRRRDETGEGCHIDMALLDTQVSVLANQALSYLVSGHPAAPDGKRAPEHRALPGFAGLRRPCDRRGRQRCAVRALCDSARRAGARDPTRASCTTRTASCTARRSSPILSRAHVKVHARSASLGTGEGGRAGRARSIPSPTSSPIRRSIARGMRLDLADPRAKGGSVPSIRSPIVFDGEPAVADRASPAARRRYGR